ncbi:Predicted membrane protein [uncultured Roseburia sp.]|uniref:ECF transporter S component n=1 Tax=Brotonthovivens ammoniilytica TaxID=2981725 RepID=A0ABT2TK73_9FIRM|nr:ECF transporter S component [Brotonthovivens ammoniilytica]MCU6762620.1 ECF transporter S component [Brotonthovivens ammoniilytica]SCI77585.1 Predicted membrane protein [uncultured Roseburia sp.]
MASGTDLTLRQKIEKKRLKVAVIMIFIAIPLVMFLGFSFLPESWYMVLSAVVLILTMAPFFMVFENRKPRAREIVLLAMMCALTVVSHIFCHIVFPIQIGTAMIIIAGISLGPEAGFLIGAMSRFVCNFYMGQGPWTPWQMFCWGLLGFLAGLAFNRNNTESVKSRNFKVIMGPVLAMAFAFGAAYLSYLIWPGEDGTFVGWRLYVFGAAGLLAGVILQKKRLPVDGLTLALFTFFTTFVIYGGIMNISKMILSVSQPGGEAMSLDALRVLYITGAPYDFMHAGTATLCVFIFGNSMIKKLERIKIKYGIYK